MTGGKKWLTQVLALVWVLGLLWAATPALAGMAELGKKRNQEGASDPAAGDGEVTVFVGTNDAYVHPTSPAETVEDILIAIAADINNDIPQKWNAVANGDSLTVVPVSGPDEVPQFGMVSTDSLLEFVQATHTNGALRVLALCEQPTQAPAPIRKAQIFRGGILAASVITNGKSAEQVNEELVEQLGPPARVRGTCGGGKSGQEGSSPSDKNRRHIKVIGPQVAWSDDDPQIKTIGVTTFSIAPIPTLSQWGLLLLVALLGTSALILIQRRRRSMEA